MLQSAPKEVRENVYDRIKEDWRGHEALTALSMACKSLRKEIAPRLFVKATFAAGRAGEDKDPHRYAARIAFFGSAPHLWQSVRRVVISSDSTPDHPMYDEFNSQTVRMRDDSVKALADLLSSSNVESLDVTLGWPSERKTLEQHLKSSKLTLPSVTRIEVWHGPSFFLAGYCPHLAVVNAHGTGSMDGLMDLDVKEVKLILTVLKKTKKVEHIRLQIGDGWYKEVDFELNTIAEIAKMPLAKNLRTLIIDSQDSLNRHGPGSKHPLRDVLPTLACFPKLDNFGFNVPANPQETSRSWGAGLPKIHPVDEAAARMVAKAVPTLTSVGFANVGSSSTYGIARSQEGDVIAITQKERSYGLQWAFDSR